MTTVDTIWYHLPVAARFAQTGQVSAIQYLDQDPVTAFFPAGSSLLHGIGILMFGTDLVSTIANIAWLGLALLAAWCMGRPFGVAPATTLGVAILLGTPGLVGTQPGGAYNDVVGIALLISAIAIIVQHRECPRSSAQDGIAALAVGLAIGTKFTFVLPAVALCVGMAVIAPKGLRLRRTVVVVACALVTGGYWYARNAIVTGNPLPSLSLKIGPFSLPSVEGTTPTSRVAKFLFDGPAWTDYFIPGLRSSLGPVWPAVVAFALVGMVGAVVQHRDARVRMLGIVGIASIAAYLVTPQYLVGGFGRPFFFSANLRYASPALAIGLTLLPVVFRRWRSWVLIAYAPARRHTARPDLVADGFRLGDDVRNSPAGPRRRARGHPRRARIDHRGRHRRGASACCSSRIPTSARTHCDSRGAASCSRRRPRTVYRRALRQDPALSPAVRMGEGHPRRSHRSDGLVHAGPIPDGRPRPHKLCAVRRRGDRRWRLPPR